MPTSSPRFGIIHKVDRSPLRACALSSSMVTAEASPSSGCLLDQYRPGRPPLGSGRLHRSHSLPHAGARSHCTPSMPLGRTLLPVSRTHSPTRARDIAGELRHGCDVRPPWNSDTKGSWKQAEDSDDVGATEELVQVPACPLTPETLQHFIEKVMRTLRCLEPRVDKSFEALGVAESHAGTRRSEANALDRHGIELQQYVASHGEAGLVYGLEHMMKVADGALEDFNTKRQL